MRGIAIILFIVLFSSCSSVVSFVTGIPNKYEGISEEKLINSAKKDYKLEATQVLIFDSIALDTFGRYPFKERWDKESTGAPAIQFAMYDSNNMLVSNYATCEGSRKRFGVWETFPPGNINPLRDTKLTFEEEAERWRKINGENIALTSFASDYKLVVYWGTFSGMFGKRLVKQAKDYIKKHPDKDIQLILVNNDSIIY